MSEFAQNAANRKGCDAHHKRGLELLRAAFRFARVSQQAESQSANLLLLTWTAGMLDALSYIRAHVFTANMTGNLVLLGIHLVERDFPDAGRALLALFAFAAGCFVAGLLILEKEDRGRPVMPIGFSAEFIFLLIFAGLFQLDRTPGGYLLQGALICTAAAALAIQSVVVRRLNVSGVVTTFLTGTITTSMLGVVRIVRKQKRTGAGGERAEEVHVALLLRMLAVYLAAVVFATVLSSRVSWIIAITPAVILAVVLWRSTGEVDRPE
ncbi:MAG: YoaK family protein [Bryobacteraceae bacterium]